MYLLDTNVILELLLEQPRADEVEQFLHSEDLSQVYLSDLALFSIGIHLFRREMAKVFVQVVEDLLGEGGIRLARLEPAEMSMVATVSQRFSLDFDDAYQYAIAARKNMIILSFDIDFDRTELGRKTPANISSVRKPPA
ncbi:MAG: type II toxin-antitoxin system VapC family toxin [Candidatus Hydrogenedentes bacterium]|nr:type II toxin-antitoxin system VapC family toxin [Candidatus Hydrogenedentota bacterium]